MVTPEQGNLLATHEAANVICLLCTEGESRKYRKVLGDAVWNLEELYPEESVTTDGEKTDLQDEIPVIEGQTLDAEAKATTSDVPDSQKPDSGESQMISFKKRYDF